MFFHKNGWLSLKSFIDSQVISPLSFNETVSCVIQIKICAEYRVVPGPRLVYQEPAEARVPYSGILRRSWYLFYSIHFPIFNSSMGLVGNPAVLPWCTVPYASVIAPALPELLWLPTVWRCPYIEIAFSTLDCSIVPTCGVWCSATAAKRGPLKQSWAEIQHSRDDEPLGVLMQMRNVRVNGFFFFSSLGVLPGVLVDTLSLCSGDFCVECVLIVLHKFYIEL